MNITLNKNKRIGKVIFVVEGEKTECDLLSKIFTDIFDYQLEVENRKNEYKIYNKKNNPLSSIFVVNSKKPQINSLKDTYLGKKDTYLENLFVKLQNEYKFPVDSARIYYIFDRDCKSNDIDTIKDLSKKLSNSMDNGTDMAGLLLLSYPSIEAFIVSNFTNNSFDIEFELGRHLKGYLYQNKDKYNYQEIEEKTLINAVSELINSLNKIGISDYDLDNFYETNEIIINYEEDYYTKNKKYKLLSLLCISLIDLGLIEIN